MACLLELEMETHVLRGMNAIERGPATARLSPTVTVAPPSSKMTTSSALWCIWNGMASPGAIVSVTTKKSWALPFCRSTLIVKGKLPRTPAGRPTRCSPSPSCKMSGYGEVELCLALLPDACVDCATAGGYGPLEVSQN